MAEFTNKRMEVLGNFFTGSTKLVRADGQSALSGDTLTVTPLTTVNGCWCTVSDGTQGSVTFSTNVLTITNSAAKTWSCLVWGT